MAGLSEVKSSRRTLGRIRCLQECIKCFERNTTLPETLCYVPAEVEYKSSKSTVVTLYASPSKQSWKIGELLCGSDCRVIVSGDDFCNSQGNWAKIKKFYAAKSSDTPVTYENDTWILLYSSQSSVDETFSLIPVEPSQTTIHGSKHGVLNKWEDFVEYKYSLCLKPIPAGIPADSNAVDNFKFCLPNWTLDHDADLAQFLCAHTEVDNENLGSIKNYVESIDVSSYSDDDEVDNLTDGDPDTYWESDGNQGQHWIRLKMKKGTIIKKLLLTIDCSDDNYMPSRILVMGGQLENLKKLNEVTLDQSLYGMQDIAILEDQKEHHPLLEVRIKECKDDGIDTRIHDIKIKSTKERDVGLSRELFTTENMVRFPKLEGFSGEFLYRRALLLKRFIALLDSVLPFIVPVWQYSIGSYNSFEVIRQLLPLSRKRMSLIDTFLRQSERCRPSRMPRLYINRRAAADHRADPSLDPDCTNTVFTQIYEGLKPRDRFEKPLCYRWPSRHDQWWECKFLSEGIIDQGGGFRDSISDLSDELCPSDTSSAVPLPFFIRSPNQNNVDANVNRDVYIPNPSCKEYIKYEWIGQLMGACLRGKENLVLSLPPFVWKKLNAETVTWSRDYVSVDEAQVKLIDNMENMDEEGFNAFFGVERTWTTVLSDGTTVPLKPDTTEQIVSYEDRHLYGKLVKETRMNEFNYQLEALKRGLLQVVPQAVLDLMTWQELERKVCGDPEITVDALRKCTHYEDLEEPDTRVKNFWLAMEAFSNEDRSRFLRFVTGRRRLPAPLYICPDKGEKCDSLPESSTCSNTLYLPNYSSAKVAEEKLRYAAFNCIAIDADLSPWDE